MPEPVRDLGWWWAPAGPSSGAYICSLKPSISLAACAPRWDTFEVWADAFITGKKSTDTDWDAYVAEMKNLSIDQYLQMYNDNNK